MASKSEMHMDTPNNRKGKNNLVHTSKHIVVSFSRHFTSDIGKFLISYVDAT